MVNNFIILMKLNILNHFRQGMDIKYNELKKKYFYISKTVLYYISFFLSVFSMLAPFFTSITVFSLLIYTGNRLFSLYVIFYLYTLKNKLYRYEINNGLMNRQISFVRYSSNKSLYNLFKIYNLTTFVPFIMFLGCFCFNLLINKDVAFLLLMVICSIIVYFIMNKIDIYFQVFSLLNYIHIIYFLNNFLSSVKWREIESISMFIKNNYNLFIFDLNNLIVYYYESMFLYSVSFLILFKLITLYFANSTLIKRFKYYKINFKDKFPKDILIYMNFVNSLSLNRRISFIIPISSIAAISIPLFINIPSQKYLFIVFVGIVVSIHTKSFMYTYAYLFHYFVIKKERQLFNFSFNSVFNIFRHKLLMLIINQFVLIIYMYLIYIIKFWKILNVFDLIILTLVYISSIILSLVEKKFIIIDYQTIKLNKDSNYGGMIEGIYSICLIMLLFIIAILDIKKIQVDISLIVLLIVSLFLIFSIVKMYAICKIWNLNPKK